MDKQVINGTDKKHKGIFDRLMRVTPSIFCPSGKKVTGLCTSLKCLNSLRCPYQKCSSCGLQVHKKCISLPLDQITPLINGKIQQWTEFLSDIFEREQMMIERIRNRREDLAWKFYNMKLKQNGLEMINRIYQEKEYAALSGKQAKKLSNQLTKSQILDDDQLTRRGQMYEKQLIQFEKKMDNLLEKCYFDVQLKLQTPVKNPQTTTIQTRQTCKLKNKYLSDGVKHRESGRLKEAYESYNNALKIDPNFAEAYNNIGAALKSQGKFQEAIVSYKKAVELNPKYAMGYNNLGVVLRKTGRYVEAITNYQMAIQIDYKVGCAYENLEILLLQQCQKSQSSHLSHLLKPTVDFLESIIIKCPDNQRVKNTLKILRKCLKKMSRE